MNIYENENSRLSNLQITFTLIYVGALLTSAFLTYNDKLRGEHRPTYLSKDATTKINFYNRSVIFLLIIGFLYINYKNRESAKQTNRDLTDFNLQLFVSFLSTFGDAIILYIAYKALVNRSNNVSEFENPES